MAQDDGGVQAKVDSAKAALSGAANSNVSPSQSPFAPKPPSKPTTEYGAARAARKSPTTGDELAEKKKNVEEYAAASKQ